MKKIIKEIIKNDPYYDSLYNFYSNKNLEELIKILELTLKNNTYAFEKNKNTIKNISNLSHYEKHNLINKLNDSKSILILNYLINEKI